MIIMTQIPLYFWWVIFISSRSGSWHSGPMLFISPADRTLFTFYKVPYTLLIGCRYIASVSTHNTLGRIRTYTLRDLNPLPLPNWATRAHNKRHSYLRVPFVNYYLGLLTVRLFSLRLKCLYNNRLLTNTAAKL